ncbi:hypothetical protein NSA60_19215 [Pseudomonas oleovorans]|uniref:Uncharacterized protein n=1 Tax=Ectopseudomonas oleovorans TaxID=301 RepID=A0AB35L3T0_ECTOL|nr:hypothetical protein [Pseudomonas oleovorans]MCR1828774.1 hypothetical protein [Pseudomonas oleovorans]MDH0569496.1 hypothetical protein [Pseudomonas oleovorans]
MNRDINMTSHPLRVWAEYFLHVSAEAMFTDAPGRHECSFGLPDGEELNVVADTPDQLARKVIAELTSALASPPPALERSGIESCSSTVTQGCPKETTTMHSNDQASVQASKTYSKAKQVTVGVSSSRSMYDTLTRLAEKRGASAAEVTRQLVEQSLESFYIQVENSSPRKIFECYEQRLRSYEGETYQWMARLDHDLGMDVKIAAQEFKKSASQIVGYFVAEGLASCAEAQEFLQDACTNEEVEKALVTIEGFIGPGAKQLAQDVGLGKRRELMTQVLAGSVLAPTRLLAALAKRLELSTASLRRAFSLNLSQSAVPSHKAEGSPTVCVTAKTWREGVEALRLPKDEEQQLLELED